MITSFLNSDCLIIQFEEAFNYIANKGYARMPPEQEKEWLELMNVIHDSGMLSYW
jgi:hypothetical protein